MFNPGNAKSRILKFVVGYNRTLKVTDIKGKIVTSDLICQKKGRKIRYCTMYFKAQLQPYDLTFFYLSRDKAQANKVKPVQRSKLITFSFGNNISKDVISFDAHT